ncbi:MAG: MBL fold metallo-hydrolase [Candidatus Omnitrophica bacterium]|nr:MBL fold metallo-hydrolase [Candidatus Omnitrophota bacterium]
MNHPRWILCLILLWPASMALGQGGMKIFWVDVEGGGATLVVTPAGETILVDTGFPGARDADHIVQVLKNEAGKDRIDHLVVTHFDLDHYGGTADLLERVPIGQIYDPGYPNDLHPVWEKGLNRYREAVGDHRIVLKAGDSLPLIQASDGPEFSVRCLGAAQKFVESPAGCPENPLCSGFIPKATDTSQNANSTTLLFQYGPFDFLDAADLTWNLENELVCPCNLVGKIDVYQVDHHGLDHSNNPVLIRTLEPTVAVANNGPRKGPGPETFATLKGTESIEAIYQIHWNLDNGKSGNTDIGRIANPEGEMNYEYVALEVRPGGESYQVRVPSKRTVEEFATKL